MLRKTAFSLFGMVLMLACINPPQAHAGVFVSIGPVYPRPVYHYVRPYPHVAPPPFVAFAPTPYACGPVFVRPGWGYPGYYRHDYWVPRRFARREYFVRRPYWRR
jgi:hypothetical protein